MMRFRLFFSAASQSRNLHLFMRNSYPGNCSQCMKLCRGINFVNRKHFCRSINEKYVSIHSNISVKEIAEKLNVEHSSIIDILKDFDHDTSNGIKTILDVDIAELIAEEYGFFVVKEKYEKSHLRPPVVTIMGHVDHGKTTLLDNLRNTSIALNEAGGITQSIGAFSVKVPGLSDIITFVDTPGHAAFNSMRARGAQLTDIVVLVVAADDGVMKQTKECLKHIDDANVPFIVAVNKIDRRNANPERVQRELLTQGVQLEGHGGDTKFVNISALKGTNIDQLLLLLNTFAKEHVFKGSHDEPVKGIIMEAEKNKEKGIVASVLVKNGKLTKGKFLVGGKSKCKVRQMYNANGEVLNEAFPSDPVQILGWRSLPMPGDEVFEMENEVEANNFLKFLAQESKPVKIVQQPLKRAFGKKGITQEFKRGGMKRIPYRVKLREEAASGIKDETDKNREINIVIKADVSGSLEALLGILTKFHSEHIKLNIIGASVGQVTITDLHLAETFSGIVYGFNTDATKNIVSKAALLKVPLKSFNVIYKLLDDLKEEIESILPYKVLENIIGEGKVLKVFKLGRVKSVAAGCQVTNGSFDKSIDNTSWQVIRDGEIIHEGVLSSLKRGATEISVAKQFTECGVVLGKYGEFQEGDKIICVEHEKLKQTFEWKL